jgi:hypothetical protein
MAATPTPNLGLPQYDESDTAALDVLLNGITSQLDTVLGADTGWVTISSFQNGFSAASPAPAYRVFRGVLFLSGQLYRSTVPSMETAFNLPAGIAPRANAQTPTVLDWQQVVQVTTGGQVQIKANTIRNSSTGYILDGFSCLVG